MPWILVLVYGVIFLWLPTVPNPVLIGQWVFIRPLVLKIVLRHWKLASIIQHCIFRWRAAVWHYSRSSTTISQCHIRAADSGSGVAQEYDAIQALVSGVVHAACSQMHRLHHNRSDRFEHLRTARTHRHDAQVVHADNDRCLTALFRWPYILDFRKEGALCIVCARRSNTATVGWCSLTERFEVGPACQ
jgi:hypothetical protein